MTEGISRGRRLTADEVVKFRQMREQAEAEKSEVARRLLSEPAGPASWADLNELRSIVESLRAERERRGMSREEVASRAGLDVRCIQDLEEQRELNPQLSTLTRFAAAVGRHLMLGLSARQAPLPKLSIESVQSSPSIETPTG